MFKIISVILLIIPFEVANAAGFQLYELGNSSIGTACVGQAVEPDASISNLNPAGMVQLEKSEMQLGSQLFISKLKFKPNRYNMISGGNGGSAGALLPGIGMFGVYSCSPNLKFGLSLTSPFGGSVGYNDGWVGRYAVQDALFLTLDINPTVAYRVNDWLAFGAGIIVEYMQVRQTMALPSTIENIDGQADLRFFSYKKGFNAGVFFRPTCDTTIGLSYRSQFHHNLKGHSTFLRIQNTPLVKSEIKTPQSVLCSLSHAIDPDITVLCELGWANWKVFKDSVINIQNFNFVIPRNWKNTYRIGAGAKLQLNDCWLIKTGASYDTSAADVKGRLPDLPIDRQVRIGAGTTYALHDKICLGLNYEFIDFGKARMKQSTRLGTFSGDYPKNYAQVFALNLNVSF